MNILLKVFMLFSFTMVVASCRSSYVDERLSDLGTASDLQELKRSVTQSSKVQFEKIVAAKWEVPLSGLTNLDHPKAIKAGLKDRDEAIEIYVFKISHPKYGDFLVDSGVAERFRKPENANEISWLVSRAMGLKKLSLVVSTKELMARSNDIRGVFLTHLHLDHILGLPDLRDVPIYTGPGEASTKRFTNFATRGTTDRLMEGIEITNEWDFSDTWIIDVFGDGSFWAIHMPGHTPGSTAFLANTSSGPQLMIGDAAHTRWGWANGVPAGSFSDDIPLSQTSLDKLKLLAEELEDVIVHPGHQSVSS